MASTELANQKNRRQQHFRVPQASMTKLLTFTRQSRNRRDVASGALLARARLRGSEAHHDQTM
jgi:hypothetical protein